MFDVKIDIMFDVKIDIMFDVKIDRDQNQLEDVLGLW